MQTIRSFPPRFASLIALAAIFVATPCRTAAQVPETSWTSVEGTTIWASIQGWDGIEVKLVRHGRPYWVPLKRLSPASIEKARKLLNIPLVAALNKPAPEVRPQPAIRPPHNPTTPLAPAPGDLAQLPEEELPTENPADDDMGSVLPDPEPAPPAIHPEPPPPSAPGRSDATRVGCQRLIPPKGAPTAVQLAVAAGNRLQDKTYKWGGGRARLEDSGYDCSGSVSYILIHSGQLGSPITSGAFTRYGAPGPGRWITIYARHGHVFMTVCGIRLDTGGHASRGPRWCASYRNARGFVMRHPPGL